jgi:hypothetical protein
MKPVQKGVEDPHYFCCPDSTIHMKYIEKKHKTLNIDIYHLAHLPSVQTDLMLAHDHHLVLVHCDDVGGGGENWVSTVVGQRRVHLMVEVDVGNDLGRQGLVGLDVLAHARVQAGKMLPEMTIMIS